MKTPKIVEGILPTVNLNMVRLKNANSIRFDEGPVLETSASKLLRWPIYITNSVDKPNYFLYSPQTQHHSFFINLPLYEKSQYRGFLE